jgi:cell division protein FtsB
MNRIQIDVITGQREVIELTAEEIAQAQANYAEWSATQPTKEEKIAQLQAQIDALSE